MNEARTVLAATQREFSLSLIRTEVNRLFDRLGLIQDQYALIRQLDESILNSGSSVDAPFRLIIEKGLGHSGGTHGQIIAFRRNRLIVTASSEENRIGTELPLKGSLSGTAVLTAKSQHCPDVRKLKQSEYVRFHRSTRSELVLLIRHSENARILGLFSLERNKAGPFDQDSIAFAELLAGQAALAFEQARRWQSVKLLYHVSTDLLSGDLSPGQAYQKILDAILDTINFEHGQVLKLVGKELLIVASSRPGDLALRVGAANSVCGHYLLTERGRTILRIPKISSSPYRPYYLGLLATDEEPMQSEMIIPILEGDRLLGAINIESPQVDPFSDFDANLLAVVRDLMAQAFSATSSRNRLASSQRIDAANLAMTQLGNVAQNYLHEFSNGVGDARGRSIELRDHLKPCDLPQIRGASVDDFLVSIIAPLTRARDTLRYFRDHFNPNQPEFQVEQMDLDEVLASCISDFRSKRRLAGVDLRYEKTLPAIQKGKKKVVGRAICELTPQVRSVIENLLNNAVDAIVDRWDSQDLAAGNDEADRNDGRIVVTLDLPDPLSARISVSDNGIGIPPAVSTNVFNFGFTTKKRTGGGIGLSFCRLYVFQRGGSIEFTRHADGPGTTFSMIFPLVIG